MPPRYAFWTILIDHKPTAFRAREREELLPTFHQLQRKNADIVMKWFARGRLWDNPEQALWAAKHVQPRPEKRGADWRPGGQHEDPRAKFAKRRRDARAPVARARFSTKSATSERGAGSASLRRDDAAGARHAKRPPKQG